MVHRMWVMFLMAVFVLAVTGTALANGRMTVDGQKQIEGAANTTEVQVVLPCQEAAKQGVEKTLLTLTEINRMAFIHSPGSSRTSAESDGQIVDVADTANTPSAVAVRKRSNQIEVGCESQIYLGTVQKTRVGLDVGCVALFMGPQGQQEVAYIHSPTLEAESMEATPAATANPAEKNSTNDDQTATLNSTCEKIEGGCVVMFFGAETEVALFMGPACVGQTV